MRYHANNVVAKLQKGGQLLVRSFGGGLYDCRMHLDGRETLDLAAKLCLEALGTPGVRVQRVGDVRYADWVAPREGEAPASPPARPEPAPPSSTRKAPKPMPEKKSPQPRRKQYRRTVQIPEVGASLPIVDLAKRVGISDATMKEWFKRADLRYKRGKPHHPSTIEVSPQLVGLLESKGITAETGASADDQVQAPPPGPEVEAPPPGPPAEEQEAPAPPPPLEEPSAEEAAEAPVEADQLAQRERPVKPPGGVMPRYIWEQKRAADLARAIHLYVDGGFIGGDYRTTVLGWMEELSGFLKQPADATNRSVAAE